MEAVVVGSAVGEVRIVAENGVGLGGIGVRCGLGGVVAGEPEVIGPGEGGGVGVGADVDGAVGEGAAVEVEDVVFDRVVGAGEEGVRG